MLTYRKYDEKVLFSLLTSQVGGSNALLWGSTLKKKNGTDSN